MTKEEAIRLLDLNREYLKNTNNIGLKDDIEALNMAIKALEQTRWIPVSERLPEVDGEYLVTETTTVNGLMGEYIDLVMYANDLYKIDEFDFSDKQGVAGWYNYDGEYGYYEVDNVIAWMHPPKPYTESEEKE